MASESDNSEKYVQRLCSWVFVKKVVRTAMLTITWISMGLYLEVAGPTLKDFSFRMDKSYAEVSGAISGRSIGKFVGVVFGGFLVDSFGRFCDLMIAVSLMVAAITTVCMPWVMHVDLLCFMYVILGMTIAVINVAGQRIVLCVWMEKAASPMHIVHLGYGIGAFIAPLIANPFLADFPPTDSIDENSTSSNKSLINTMNITMSYPEPVSKIESAYVIIAIMACCVAAVFFVYQVLLLREWKRDNNMDTEYEGTEMGERESLNSAENKTAKEGTVINDKLYRKKSLLEMINPAKCANGRCLFGSAVLGFLFLRYMMISGMDRNMGIFLRTYAVDHLNFTKDDSSILNSMFFLFYGLGRLVAFVVAMCVSIKAMLMVESFAMLGVAISSVIFARDNDMAFWVLTCMAGFFIGPMFPSGIAWGDVHIDMTGLAITWVFLGSAIGGWSMLKFASLLYDAYGIGVYVFVSLGFCAALLLTDIILTAISVVNSRILKRKTLDDDRND